MEFPVLVCTNDLTNPMGGLALCNPFSGKLPQMISRLVVVLVLVLVRSPCWPGVTWWSMRDSCLVQRQVKTDRQTDRPTDRQTDRETD